MKHNTMKRRGKTSFLVMALAFAAACEPLAPVGPTGTLSGGFSFVGTWPDSGTVLVNVYANSPWEDGMGAQTPVAIEFVNAPAADRVVSYITEGVPYGTYAAVVLAWGDPDELDACRKYRPLADYGSAVTLSEEVPSLGNIDFGVVDFGDGTAVTLRGNFPIFSSCP